MRETTTENILPQYFSCVASAWSYSREFSVWVIDHCSSEIPATTWQRFLNYFAERLMGGVKRY